MILQFSRSVCCAAVVLLVIGASTTPGFEGVLRNTSPSCVHELVYEPFAGLILVSVTINGSPPLDFILDSGATQSAINDPYLANSLGLKAREAGLARGMGSGATRVLIADDTSIRSDGVEILRDQLVVHDISERLAALAGREIDGFLGADLFSRYVVEIDPFGHRLLLHDPNTFDYRGPGESLPLEVVDRRPVVAGAVRVEEGGREILVRLLIDTGSGRYLNLITKSRRRLKPPPEQTLGASVGVVGNTLVTMSPVWRLRLGSSVVENVEAAWTEPFQVPAVRNIPNLNGIVGNQLLRRFRIFFDYRGGRLILETLSGSPYAVHGFSD
jgi:hypothetical protein